MLRNLVLALTSVALFGSGGGMQASAQSVPKSLQGAGVRNRSDSARILGR